MCPRLACAQGVSNGSRAPRPANRSGAFPLLALSECQRRSHYYKSSPCGRRAAGRRLLFRGVQSAVPRRRAPMPLRRGHGLPMGSFATRWLHWLSMLPHTDPRRQRHRIVHAVGSRWAAGRRGCFQRHHSARLLSIGTKRNGERSSCRLCRFKSCELNVSNRTLIRGVLDITTPRTGLPSKSRISGCRLHCRVGGRQHGSRVTREWLTGAA